MAAAKHGLFALSPDGKSFVTVSAPQSTNIFDKSANVNPGAVFLHRLDTGWKPQKLTDLQVETKPPTPAFSTD